MPFAPHWHIPTPCPYPSPENVHPPEKGTTFILRLLILAYPAAWRNDAAAVSRVTPPDASRIRLALPVRVAPTMPMDRSPPALTPSARATRFPSARLIRYTHRRAGLSRQSSQATDRRYGTSRPHASAAFSVLPPHVEW